MSIDSLKKQMSDVERPSDGRFIAFSLLILGLINFIQSIVLDMNYDEAYYWLFSKHLDWGYFDHPPLTALMVKLGTLVTESEWGVRLLFVISTPLYLWLFWKMIKPEGATRKDEVYFFMVFSAIPLVQIYGFLATPDVPLMLFAVLLFRVYERFLVALKGERGGSGVWTAAILMGGVLALLAYSKYHAVLLVLAILISNRKLLTVRWTYLAALIALILYLPHLIWQYQHDFVSFRFHLSERSDLFKTRYITEFLLNTFLTFNPFLFILMMIGWWRTPFTSHRNRLFVVLTFLFLIFFFMSSFRGHAQPQWLIPLVFPLGAFLLHHIRGNRKLERYVMRASLFSWLLFVAARVAICLNVPVLQNAGFNHNKEDMERLSDVAKEKPLLLLKYQVGGLYAYYTGKPVSVQPGINDRQSQFDLWCFDDDWAGREVFVQSETGTIIPEIKGREGIKLTELNFVPTRRCAVMFDLNDTNLENNQKLSLEIKVNNPYPWPIELSPEGAFRLHAVFIDEDERSKEHLVNLSSLLAPGEETRLMVDVIVPGDITGEYKLGFAIQRFPQYYYFCSPKRKVFINLAR